MKLALTCFTWVFVKLSVAEMEDKDQEARKK